MRCMYWYYAKLLGENLGCPVGGQLPTSKRPHYTNWCKLFMLGDAGTYAVLAPKHKTNFWYFLQPLHVTEIALSRSKTSVALIMYASKLSTARLWIQYGQGSKQRFLTLTDSNTCWHIADSSARLQGVLVGGIRPSVAVCFTLSNWCGWAVAFLCVCAISGTAGGRR